MTVIYTDDFLRALGAWQNGWKEDRTRRLEITASLVAAIGTLPEPLPRRHPPPVCYRKRFLRPHNPQNPVEMGQLILNGRVDEGVASWTTDPEYAREFKKLVRDGCITALFEHQPTEGEVLVDIPHLWQDCSFSAALDDYIARKGEHAAALQNFSDRQSELILRAPLLLSDVFGLVGQIGSYEQLFQLAGATSDEQQDELVDRIIEANCYPGQARWLHRAAAQRALERTRTRIQARIDDFFL